MRSATTGSILALYFSRTFGGVVDFGGYLEGVATRSGRLHQVVYPMGTIPHAFHASDAAFLEAWLADPAFHMIK